MDWDELIRDAGSTGGDDPRIAWPARLSAGRVYQAVESPGAGL